MRTQEIAVTTIWILAAASGLAKQNSLPAVTLRIENEARIDDRVLREARKEATAMLIRAGVTLIWTDCGTGIADRQDRPLCRQARGRNEFWMRITMNRPGWSPKETLGFADLTNGDGSAGVYYPAVIALVNDSRGAAPQILAAAMVHEVGHLILGAEHTTAGVMCANWSREQFKLISGGRFDFAPGQPKLLQSELRRRAFEKEQRKPVGADEQ
jgi:hypothetical protein